ncbi:MAG TPA: flagellar hook-basal body complex protein FliE [Rhodospirillaceae bacterium]|nr:MAG: flagellar hook-basal body complex protein FliE [Alphaproteobacteria bacterium GWF2_58_20]HAU28939.1 flagellar hook-basal body complex protein FliE [Rhodospirillaceae bacterium]
MTLNIGSATQAYAGTSALSGKGMDARTEGGSFSGLVKAAMQHVTETQAQAQDATLQAVSGKADVAEVVTAINNAELALDAVVAVRDKVVSAYQEIMRMSI